MNQKCVCNHSLELQLSHFRLLLAVLAPLCEMVISEAALTVVLEGETTSAIANRNLDVNLYLPLSPISGLAIFRCAVSDFVFLPYWWEPV